MTTARKPEHLKREADIQRDVVGLFERLQCVVYLTSEPRAKLTSTPGMFDLYLLLPNARRVPCG